VLGAALTLALSFTYVAFAGTATGAGAGAADADGTTPMLVSPEDCFKLIRRRRSVFPKDYTGAPVPRHILERALEAANWAPTHGKTEPWRFVVFRGEALSRFHAIKREATERHYAGRPEELHAALAKIDKKRAELEKVSAIIAIVLKRVPNSKDKLMPDWEEHCAVACSVQNLHLQLTAEGFAGYWSSAGVDGWADDSEVRRLVGADEQVGGKHDCVMGWFHVGVCDKSPDSFQRRPKPIEGKVKWL